MSADNGVYILPCDDGFIVEHCQGIENVYEGCETGEPYDVGILEEYFFRGKKLATEKAARLYADTLEADYMVLEYGICWLEPYSGTIETWEEQLDRLNS